MDDRIPAFINRVKRQQRVLERHLLHIAVVAEEGASAGAGVLWGEKECATSAIARLALAQIKWAELELAALRLVHRGDMPLAETDAPLQAEDFAILQLSLLRQVQREDDAVSPPLPGSVVTA